MSHNPSRAERSDSAHYKKTSRSGSSNQQRSFSGGVSSKGGGGAASVSSNPSSRSFQKHNNNASGAQFVGRRPIVNADSNVQSLAHVVQNGAHQGQSIHGSSVAPVTSSNFNVILTDAPSQNPIPAIPRTSSSNVAPVAPHSIISAASSEAKPPTTPAKSSSDTSKSFPLQFGSISPGFVNGMQIPARTSSAPPNLDEQKKDQARHDTLSVIPSIPIPSIPKHHLPQKDAGFMNQYTAGEAQSGPKSRREPQVSAVSSVTQTHMPAVLPIPGLHVQVPYHQQHVSAQFGGPKPQIQSQPMPGTSLAMPMQIPISIPLPMGNPQVQQPMFVSGLQPHHMQSQVMTHQGQALNFSPQMGPQIPPHLGNLGMNMVSQFSQQQGGKYSSSRKTVKITHPDTHEELRLDDSPGSRLHSMVPTQSKTIQSFPPNYTMNFFPNSYSAAPLYYPTVGSVPSTQVTPASQPQRFYNQVAVKVAVGPGSHGEKEILPPTSAHSVVKAHSMKLSLVNIEDSAHPMRETEVSSSLPREKLDLGTSAILKTPSSPVNLEIDVPNISTSSADSNISLPTPIISSDDSQGVVVPDSSKGENSDNRDLHDQISLRSTSISSFPSQPFEVKTVEAKSSLSETILLPEAAEGFSATSVIPLSEVSNLLEDTVCSATINMKGVRLNSDTMVSMKGGETILSERLKQDQISRDTYLQPLALESSDHACKTQNCSNNEVLATSVTLSDQAQQNTEEFSGKVANDAFHANHYEDSGSIETYTSVTSLSTSDGEISLSDMASTMLQNRSVQESMALDPSALDQEPTPDLVSSPEDGLKYENEDSDSKICVSVSSAVVSDKGLSDPKLGKSVVPRGKKKKKDLYRKAEAAGTSSDIYGAYKGPEEKKDVTYSMEGTDINSNGGVKQPTGVPQEIASSSENLAQSKVEPEDWEDAAEISTPQIETSKCENSVNDGDMGSTLRHSYTRDFLLKFCDHAILPDNFELTADIADVLMVSNVQFSHEPYPSLGRNADRPSGGPRLDRRGSALGDEERWSKFPGPLVSGRGNTRPDVGYVVNIPGFRINQTGNYGVLRNLRAPSSVQYVEGILSGPMQPIGHQGSLQRNNSDAEKWLRGTGFQKGFMPSPQTPLQVMHKAEKKYEVGKVTDEEEAKQRQLKSILNKLTPQNFQKLFEQVKQVNIDNVVTLSGVIAQIFDKALMEPTFCEMYANFCLHLAADLPDLTVDSETVTFKRLLLNKCQEEFEREEMEENEANKVEEGEYKLTAEEREEKRLQARRRMLGNIRLIGELYKKKMLTERIMHDCISKLLGQNQTPDEENIEALCKLMSTIGEMIDHPKAKEHMDVYFGFMSQLSNDLKLSSRVRFMLKDIIDLRMNSWQQRRKVEGPKMIEEVHRDAAQERQAQASRLGRAPSFGGPVRRTTPMDYSPRAPNTTVSPSSQMGGFRSAPPQQRGYGSQDARIEERHSFENRAIPVPLPQRTLGDEPITLGPQGGLARGMAFRGQQSAPNSSLAEQSSGYVRRVGPGLNGSNSTSNRSAYGQRDDVLPRYSVDRTGAPSNYDQSFSQDRNVSNLNRDMKHLSYGSDRSLPASPPDRGGPPFILQEVSAEMVWPAHLEEKSMTAIKEYYSDRDESEVTLCIRDLNTPSFYPSMISLWVTDSFERKGMERDLLTKLLINLAQPRDGLINEDQLSKGFEFVLAALEDTVNDAPKAAEYLGQIFAQLILEKVVALSEIGRLIHEGGEEPGHLVEIGLASDVLGSTLDTIKSEKGDFVLDEMRSRSNLLLESFRPQAQKNRGEYRIDKFIRG